MNEGMWALDGSKVVERRNQEGKNRDSKITLTLIVN